MRFNVSTKWLLAGAVLAFLAGCGGCYNSPEERHLVLSFASPTPGQQLSEDKDTTRGGLQSDVEVKLEWEDLSSGERTPADLEDAALSIAASGDAFGDAVTGTVGPEGQAIFSGVTFTKDGDWQLRATAKELGTHQTSDPVTITVSVLQATAKPVVLSMTVTQDANTDDQLSLAELPVGQTVKLDFTTQQTPTGGVAWVTNGPSGPGLSTEQSFSQLAGSVNLDLIPATATEQTFALVLHVRTPEGAESDVVPAAQRTITVDQVAPTIVINEPTDRDGGYSSAQIDAVATVTGAEQRTVSFVAIAEDGGTMDAGTATVQNGVAQTKVKLFDPGVQTLTADVSDLAGNPAPQASTRVWVNTEACLVTLNVPGYLGPSQDSNTTTAGFQYVITGTTSGCQPFRSGVINVNGMPTNITTDATGAFSLEVTLNSGATNSVRADIDNGSGTFGTAVADVFVGTADFKLNQPANNQVLNIASDLDAAAADIQYILSYQPAPGAGQSVTICSSIAGPGGSTACPDGSGWFVMKTDVASTENRFTYAPQGTYQIKGLLFSGGTIIAVTPAVTITVDNSAPALGTFALQGDANSDLSLNGTEQSSGAAVAVIATSGMEDGQTVTVRNRQTNAVVNTGTVSNGMVSITLTGMSGPEADYQLSIEMTDAAGNPSTPVSKDIRVDRVAPVVTITQPTKSNLGPSDDADAVTAGYQLHVEGSAQADLASMSFQATSTATGTVSGSATVAQGATLASTDLTVASSGTNQYTISVTATDRSGNTSTAVTKQVVVDFDAPTPTIQNPNTAGSPYTQYTLPTTVSVPNENGLTVTIFSSLQTQALGTLTVVNGSATGDITYPNGAQTLTAVVSDLAGNQGTSAAMQITVAGTGCSITLATPAPGTQYLNKSADKNAGTATTLEYDVTGTSANCPNRTVTVFSGSGASRTSLGTTTTNGSGAFTAPISLPEGAQHLEVEMTDIGGVTRFVTADFTVDLTPPSISAVSPAGSSLFFVTPQNKRIGVTPGYIADADTGTAGAQTTFSFQATGANGGKAQVLFGGSAAATQVDVTADPQTLSSGATLPQATNGQVEIRVTDAAGNTASYTTNATIDVVAPAAPSFTLTLANSRRATVNVAWGAVYDDGSSTPSGSVNGYDLRWSTTTLLPSGIPDETTFFGTKAKQHTGALLPSTALTATLTPPPINTYWVAVRAVDDLGNYSAFVPASSLANPWLQQQFTNPGPSGGYGSALTANGDINGDGITDLVVGAGTGTQPGRVHVYFGSTTPGSMTAQTIAPPDTVTQYFGLDVAVANIGDAAGENLGDVIVGAPLWSSNTGRVYIYFGRVGSTIDTSAPVVLVGNASSRLGWRVSSIADLNGDQRPELVIGAPYENSLQGRVYIFYSRTVSAWQALQSANGGAIPMSAADKQIEGPNPPAVGTVKNGFGSNRGVAALGDIDGDGVPDFTTAGSSDSLNQLFVFSGATVLGRTSSTGVPTLTTGSGAITNDALQTLTAPYAPGTGSSADGFGSSGVGGVSVIGSAATDLVVGAGKDNSIYIYAGGSSPAFGTTSLGIHGIQFFGRLVRVADVNGDGLPDLFTGEAAATNSSAWLLFNTGTAGAEFDTAVTNYAPFPAGSGFSQSQLKSTTALGNSVAVGDFNGDSKLDIVAGDTSGSGTVTLWY